MAASYLYIVDEHELNAHPQEYVHFIRHLEEQGCTDLGARAFNKPDDMLTEGTGYEAYIVLAGSVRPAGTRVHVDYGIYRTFAMQHKRNFHPERLADGLSSIRYRGPIPKW